MNYKKAASGTFKNRLWLVAVLAAMNILLFCAVGIAAEAGGIPITFGGEPGTVDKPAPEMDFSPLRSEEEEPLTESREQSESERRALRRQQAQGANILSVTVEGNREVVTDHILSVITSKVGTPIDQNRITRDADAIYELGFFSNVDYRLIDEQDGTNVVFLVRENPTIEDIHFFGNESYSEDKLKDLCFSKPGMIFNRVFFRNDLQRVREKYQQDGFVMARVSDVKIEGTVVNVYITEPKIADIIIQGNKRTKTYVIERQIVLKRGDLFNATILRHVLSKLQGIGYFDDVSVGFEPSPENPSDVDIVLTVAEAKTGRIGISVGYGTQSGFSGGLSYGDNNFRGLGQKLSVGFEEGDRSQYWASLEQPYMDQKVFAWRFGAYQREWDNIAFYDQRDIYRFDYDELRKGIYAGFGRKFSERSKLSWYLQTEWQDVEIETLYGAKPTQHQLEEMQSGKNFLVQGTLMRSNMDPYLPYPKGDVESIHVEKGMEALGGEWDYWKYWVEAKYYTPLGRFFANLFERNFTVDDIPPILAFRMIAGDSDGYLPWAVDYVLGGDNTLRGYEDRRFRGDQMFLLNSEARLPVHKNVSIVLFYDAGKAWDTSYANQKFDLGDLADSYGLGVRMRTPLGNLRLDFAQGDEESRVHFGFGEMF